MLCSSSGSGRGCGVGRPRSWEDRVVMDGELRIGNLRAGRYKRAGVPGFAEPYLEAFCIGRVISFVAFF
jgi:hypothetical protein